MTCYGRSALVPGIVRRFEEIGYADLVRMPLAHFEGYLFCPIR